MFNHIITYYLMRSFDRKLSHWERTEARRLANKYEALMP